MSIRDMDLFGYSAIHVMYRLVVGIARIMILENMIFAIIIRVNIIDVKSVVMEIMI